MTGAPRRSPQRDGPVGLEVHDERMHDAKLTAVELRVKHTAPERKAGAEGRRVTHVERGKLELVRGVNLRGEDGKAGENRAANSSRIGRAVQGRAVPAAVGKPGAQLPKHVD